VIIVSDASQNDRRTFATLAHAISRARIDLDVNIEFSENQSVDQTNAPGGRVTIGRIAYPDGQDGLMIYIKPEVLGTEPMDVVGYARMHASFPHDPTLSQWFTEGQFEAYRKLGELSGEAAAGEYWSRCGSAGSDMESVTQLSRCEVEKSGLGHE
jgi:hypothetical protein